MHRGPAALRNSASYADGRISAVNATTLKVTSTTSGTVRDYTLGSATTIHRGPGQKLSPSALRVGDQVHVRGQASTTGGSSTGSLAAVNVDVHLAHIDGLVTAVTGSSVTVTDRDGFTREITTTGANGVHTGEVIHAQGRVDANGTTLDATSIGAPPAPHLSGPKAGGPKAGGPKGKGHAGNAGHPAPASPNGARAGAPKGNGAHPAPPIPPTGKPTRPAPPTASSPKTNTPGQVPPPTTPNSGNPTGGPSTSTSSSSSSSSSSSTDGS